MIPVTPEAASINRIVIVDLPGQPVDHEVRDKRASYLLSVPALIRYAHAAADALAMPRALREADPELPETRRDLPRWVDGCLTRPDPQVQAAAHAIARRLGRNLGALVAALHRGDAANRAARADWTDREWEHWRQVRKVWIGGGIVSGDLGAAMVPHAREVLAETGCDPGLTIARTPYPQHMTTLGAARYLPAGSTTTPEHALIVDFGQTSVKRALVSYRRGAVARLFWLPSQAAAWRWPSPPSDGRAPPPRPASVASAREVLSFVTEAICTGLALAEAHLGAPVRPEVVASIAAYVEGGAVLGNGIYALMRHLADDVRPLVADSVAAACDRRIRLAIIHDGAAAAAVHAGEPPAPSAVIVVGTALGVGFPASEAAGLRPIAPDLA